MLEGQEDDQDGSTKILGISSLEKSGSPQEVVLNGPDNVGEDDGTSDEDDTAFDTAINYSAHVSCFSFFASCAFAHFTQRSYGSEHGVDS